MAILVAEKVPIFNGKRIFLQSRPNINVIFSKTPRYAEMKFSVRIPDTLIMIPRYVTTVAYLCFFVASLLYIVFTVFSIKKMRF